MSSRYNDSPEEAGKIARLAIPMASRLGLPVDPHIYEVCYLYTAKRNSNLCQALDKLLKKDSTLDKYELELLYYEHILEEDVSALQLLKQAVETLMNSTQGALQHAQTSTQDYEHTLQNAAAELMNAELGSDLVKTVVGRLLQKTTQIQASTEKLQDQLRTAQTEVAQLQEEYNRIRNESLTDPLTGLQNRRAFQESFEDLCKAAQAIDEPLSLLVIDIDHFKTINDSFGHSVGDAVLRCVAKIIKNSVRGDDVAARFGGEEFVVLLPDTPNNGAKKVAEKIRHVIASQTLRHKDVEIGRVTVSIGLAQLQTTDSINDLFDRADKALYQAKHKGRNCVCET